MTLREPDLVERGCESLTLREDDLMLSLREPELVERG
jgi:hypothetical protein